MRKLPLAVLAALLVLVASAFAAGNRPNSISLPDGWSPEGIAAHGSKLYVGSLSNGGIFTTDTKGRHAKILNAGDRGNRAVAGIKVAGNKIFAAGAATGKIHVFSRRGALLQTLAPAGAGFVNDVAIRGNSAYFTDSQQQVFYVVRRDLRGGVRTVSIKGAFTYTPDTTDFDANGIVAAGRRLIIVQSNTGKLFSVDPRTGDSTEIPLTGRATDVKNGDGLLLVGRTLYVGQNNDQISVVRLSRNLASGRVTQIITNADQPAGAKFDTPTTLARANGDLWVVNARFNSVGQNPPATTPFNIVRVAKVRNANGHGHGHAHGHAHGPAHR
jgi:hypothetical protein